MQGDPKIRRLLSRVLRMLHRVHVTGLQHVPPTGRVVAAMNHSGVRGALVFEALLKRDIVYVASGRFLRLPVIRERAMQMSALFVTKADMLSTRLFDEGEDIVSGGSMLGVMIEGIQMMEGQPLPKRGAMYLAYRLQADILPVRIRKRWWRIDVEVHPLMPSPSSVNAKVLQASLDEVCQKIGLGKLA